MANLFVCCDGTWNAADNKDDGVLAPTNVRKLFHCLKSEPGKQETRYQSGVGTGGALDKALGGMLGVGISEDIRDCYEWLCDKYQPGDRIFLFGFSRGAFSARSLGGMICRFGLADFSVCDATERNEVVEEIYTQGYRENGTKDLLMSLDLNIKFRPDSDKVFFIGVWDTVGALGVPDDKAILDLFDDPARYSFHDTKLSSSVAHARQALAIDERRGSFSPTLWTQDDSNLDSDLVQKWFPGVHSDVGGGYKENGLSNGALSWMIDEINKTADDILWDTKQVHQISSDYQDELHDSHTGAMKVLITVPRSIPDIQSEPDLYHESALNRHDDPPIVQGPYLNVNDIALNKKVTVDIYAKHQYYWTGIYLQAGKTYKLSADGAWADSKIVCGPMGASDGSYHPQELLHTFGSLVGKIESTIFKDIFGKEHANLIVTKRHEDSPWFCLMGAIANGGNPDEDGTAAPMESFPIGEGTSRTPGKSGYLYCYANDAWAFYGNNRGYVTLTVEEV